MLRKWAGVKIEQSSVRLFLALILILIGLAPVGVPILSDSGVRQALRPGSGVPAPADWTYRWQAEPSGASRIERSVDSGSTWRPVGSVPGTVVQVEARSSNPHIVFARGNDGLWRSEDGGAGWQRVALASRPLSLALASNVPGLLFVGTESLGLYRSGDNGLTWQELGEGLAPSGPGAPSVTALAVDPEDDRLVYAAAGNWFGTTRRTFAPQGVYVSTDYGQHWFEMTPQTASSPTGGMVTSLALDPARPLAVSTTSEAGEVAYSLALTPAFAARLDDQDPGIRAAVARALGVSRAQSVLPALLAHLDDPDLLAGDQVAEAIGLLGSPAAIPDLTQALVHPDENVRARAAAVLGTLKSGGSVPALASMLHNDRPVVRQRAAEALGQIGTQAAIDALIGPLADQELTPARQAAMRGLELAGQPAVGPLTRALHAQNAVVRRNSAEMLGWLAPESATDDLAQALGDPDPTVRSEAAWALGQVSTLEAQQALAQAVQREGDAKVRETAQQALVQVQARRHLSLSFGSALAAALNGIPASRWTFLGLVVLVAAMLLVSNTRRLSTQRS